MPLPPRPNISVLCSLTLPYTPSHTAIPPRLPRYTMPPPPRPKTSITSSCSSSVTVFLDSHKSTRGWVVVRLGMSLHVLPCPPQYTPRAYDYYYYHYHLWVGCAQHTCESHITQHAPHSRGRTCGRHHTCASHSTHCFGGVGLV